MPLHCPARKNILFDLDGTLLPMNMEEYLRLYISGLCRQIPAVPAEKMFRVLWEGIAAMMKNDGKITNREAFAQVFTAGTGIDYFENEEKFRTFYRTDYPKCIASCTPSPLAGKIISALQQKGYNVIIATSPLYPAEAALERLRWAEIAGFGYSLVTTFDNFHTAKPNPAYYLEICDKLNLSPEDCLMVGNDVEEDGVCLKTGMDMILVTDCIINKKNLPIDSFHIATLQDVLVWAEALPALI